MGPLRTHREIQRVSPKTRNMFVMGPWTHGGWARTDGDRVGNLNFGQKTAVFYRESIEFPFFAEHLKDRKDQELPEAYMFKTGTNRWRTFDAWPPKQVAPRTFYLRERGQLLTEAPAAMEAFDEYVSDPARPVPYVGHVQIGMQADCMTED